MSYFNAQRSGVVYPGTWSTSVNGQMMNDVENTHMHTQMYHINPHMFHSPSNDWLQAPTSDLYGTNAHSLIHQYQQQPHHQLHHAQQQYSQHQQHNAATHHQHSALQSQQQPEHHQQTSQQQQALQQHLHSPQSQQTRSHAASNLSSPSSNGLTVPAGPNSAASARLNESTSNGNHVGHAIHSSNLSSPPITVSGSEVSSPDAPRTNASPLSLAHNLVSSRSSPGNNMNSSANMLSVNDNNNNSLNNSGNSRAVNENSPQVEYDWMRKNTYPTQPTPGKTRTKDKYRVVYNDNQRLELEKEFRTSRYITIRRKSELALALALSERQVKIWFQNRRAKERKQTKKDTNGIRSDMLAAAGHRLEADSSYQHSLHAMNHHHQLASMSMRLHSHLPIHSHYAAAAAAHTHSHAHPLQHNHHIPTAAVASANMNVGGSMQANTPLSTM